MTGPASIAEQVSAALDRGAVVITSNERSARTLRQQHAALLQTPQQVLSLRAWVDGEWQARLAQGLEERVPLTAPQEQRLWEELVLSDKSVRTLLARDSIAELAMSAYALLGRWNARELLARPGGSSDVASFRRWVERFERGCTAEGWIASEMLGTELAKSVSRIRSASAKHFLFVGFDEMLPSQRLLLRALEEAGATVEVAQMPTPASALALAAADNPEDEFAMCSAWARARADEGKRVAILHADTASVRPQLDRALRLHADAAANDIGHSKFEERFEFSLGMPFASVLMVRHALLCLQLAAGELPLESASELVRSRYLFTPDTWTLRAEFDANTLRSDQALRAEVGAEVLAQLLREQIHGRPRWPQLLPLADALHTSASLMRGSQHRRWDEWTALVQQVLASMHFATAGGETSFEFQVLRRWEELLDDLARLQVIDGDVTWSTAYGKLKQMCTRMLFAVESHDAPIQVMSPAEAAGSEFDALWLLGADDASWPPRSAPHPLLPFQLQVEAGMPGASWKRASERAETTVQRLIHSAAEVVVSYSRTTPRGEHARLSPLFSAHDFLPFAGPPSASTEPVDLVQEEQIKVLPAFPQGTVRGGARVLELQAACPFRAFAELRLFSVSPGKSTDGMNAGVRGVALHKVLERFWLLVASRKALVQISAPDEVTGAVQRTRMLEEVVDDVLGTERASAWEQQYMALERERILTLANRWLDKELQRKEDFWIEELEQEKKSVGIGPLHLNVRVDRVDRVRTEAGREGLVLIDYKTSAHNPGKWLGDRPDQPQLPLYAAVLDCDDLMGIAFANVTPGDRDFGLKGVSDDESIFGSRNTVDLKQQLAVWQQSLEVLADNFASGYAMVDPKRPATCTYCEQRILCRVSSLRAGDDGDEQEDAE